MRSRTGSYRGKGNLVLISLGGEKFRVAGRVAPP